MWAVGGHLQEGEHYQCDDGQVREPLNNSLRAQRGLKGAAVVFCRDGPGGSLS